MKKTLMNVLAGAVVFSAAAQSKSDTDTIQKEVMQQHELAMQKHEEAMKLHKAAMQKLQESMALQKEAIKKQQEMVEQQKVAVAKQQVLVKKQQELVKEQQAVLQVFKEALLKDGLIRKNERYELLLNSRELIINGTRQPAAVHRRYIDLLNGKRKKPFGEKEQWQLIFGEDEQWQLKE